MGYAVYQNRVYQYRIPRCHSDTAIILDDGLCGKTVQIAQCTVFVHVNIKVKYQSEWYPFPSGGLRDKKYLTLYGGKQEGFCYRYDGGGFPIYTKEIVFPDGISEAVVQITESKQSGELVHSYYKFPMAQFDWWGGDLMIRVLTEIYINGRGEKVSADYVS